MKDFRKMNKNNNKQDLVNSNMEQLFNLPPGSTAQDKSNKVLRSNKKDPSDKTLYDGLDPEDNVNDWEKIYV